ncbi:GNAT family N-acetyltransferase [Chryseobacterium sp. SL1]|uniref:GNAT family N-acetyltransferase n=1 Tax=Chryseobacterium sp. SL1 TaxID=2995159 RepID=UPI0022722F5A|nr:GNAT family protein [Chryseobacterium sp. SL1]MCY1661966.1 GNAT family protein [Chryseobacterium sp. SL1]
MYLETERLLIRDLTLDDKQAVFNYRSDAEANKFQGWIPETLEDVEQFIERNNKEFNQPESWYQVLITEKDSKAVIGDIGIHFFGSENLQAELGITLNKDFQGRGFASEALKGVINFLFGDLKKHRIMASIDPENIDSLKLMERIGFRKEGHFVKSLFWKNNWTDDVIYALLREEWSKE